MRNLKNYFVSLSILSLGLVLLLLWRITTMSQRGVFDYILVIMPLLIQGLITGSWIFFDSKKVFKSSFNEALSDTGFSLYGATLPTILNYFNKRERFLKNETYRQEFIKNRELARIPLAGVVRKKVIILLALLIITIFGLFTFKLLTQ